MADLDDIVKILLPKKVRKRLKKNKKKFAKEFVSLVLGWFRNLFSGSGSKKSAKSAATSASAPTNQQQPPGKVKNHPLQSQLERAEEYAVAIRQQAAQANTEMSRDRLHNLALHIADWQQKLQRLANQVILYEQDSLLQRDLKEVPRAIKDLEKRAAAEENEQVRAAVERTLEQRRRQWASLEKLQNTMRLAEVKIESTVSMLGTIYSQTQIGSSRGQVADYRHLLAEVDEETMALQDYLEALEEVKYGRPSLAY